MKVFFDLKFNAKIVGFLTKLKNFRILCTRDLNLEGYMIFHKLKMSYLYEYFFLVILKWTNIPKMLRKIKENLGKSRQIGI